MIKYIKCPRCELNYIDSEKQEYCDVCIAELKGKKLQFADLDDEFDDAAEKTEICPVCGVNPIRYGDKMCEACKQASRFEDEVEDVDIENDEEWKNYLEDDEDLTVDGETLEEELSEELDDEYDDELAEESYEDDDPLNDYDDFDADDLDDEDDDDDDDEDDDDDLF